MFRLSLTLLRNCVPTWHELVHLFNGDGMFSARYERNLSVQPVLVCIGLTYLRDLSLPQC